LTGIGAFFAVIPAKAGIQADDLTIELWIPAFAGMTAQRTTG
jgi:hypothetical protein